MSRDMKVEHVHSRVFANRRTMLLFAVLHFVSTIAVCQFVVKHVIPFPPKAPEQNITQQEAYATLITSDSYAPGVVALGRTIQKMVDTRRSLPRDTICLVTSDVSAAVRETLQEEGWKLQEVASIDSPYRTSTRFHGTFSKLHLWNLTSYDKVLYLDADTLVLNPVDELFACSNFCVVPNEDAKGLYMFNSGVMVLRPSRDMSQFLMDALASLTFASWDNADQGFLNSVMYWYCKGLLGPRESANGDNKLTTTAISNITTAVLETIEPAHLRTSLRPPQLFSALVARQPLCQSLPLSYNYRINVFEWRFYQPYLISTPIHILQYTGSRKPWECEEKTSTHFTFAQWLLCKSQYGRLFAEASQPKRT